MPEEEAGGTTRVTEAFLPEMNVGSGYPGSTGPQATGPVAGRLWATGTGSHPDLGGQSSGILIQPWRMAYTTAWVRSLTDSLRRMLDMWFLTVCSLMVRA